MNENDNAEITKTAVLNEWESSLTQRDKRALIFHLLYGADSYDYTSSTESFADNLNRGFELSISLDGPLVKIADEITKKRNEIDQMFHPFLDNWRPERLSVCTKLVLRYATWELLHTKTNPVIIINEAIELAKAYAEKDSYKLVNGVLDKLTKHYNISIEIKEQEKSTVASPIEEKEEESISL